MSLKNFTIENVALVKTITDLNGEIVLNPQEIRTKNMKARVAGETVTVEAGIDDVATAQRLEAKIRAETSLKNIEPLVRDQIGANLKDIALDGDAQVLLSVTDSLTDDAPARIVSSIEFGNASLAAPKLPAPLKNMSGILELEGDRFTLRDIKGTFIDKEFKLAGTVREFERPVINLELNTDDLSVDADFSIAEDTATINKARVNYRNINGVFSGHVYELNDPNLNIYGNITFSVYDIVRLLPEKFSGLQNADCDGWCGAEVFIGGKPSDLASFETGVKLRSDEIKIKDFRGRNLRMKLTLQDGLLLINPLVMEPYSGLLEIKAGFDLNKEPSPYELVAHLRELQLAELIHDTKLKGSDIYGNLSATLDMSGALNDASSVKGEAWLHVTDAHLGPLPVFIPVIRNVMGFLASRLPGYEKVKLKEATATFAIENKVITTHDFILWGDTASVLYDGTVDFDGNLDFRVENNFAEGLSDEKTDFGTALSVFVTQMGGFISEARLTGTLREPKYSFKPFPVDKFFKDNFKNLFQNIFR
jgi:hypothetical protein